MANTKRDFLSWPYPKDLEQLLHVIMIVAALLLIGLVVTANRYKSYQDQTLDKGQISAAAESLTSLATEANRTLQLAEQGKVSRNFREAYSDQISQQAKQVVDYVSHHRIVPAYQSDARQLTEYGSDLQITLEDLAKPVNEGSLKNAQQTVEKLQEQLSDVEEGI